MCWNATRRLVATLNRWWTRASRRGPAEARLLTFAILALVGAATAHGSPAVVRGLPFARSYPLDEIGNAPRGVRLSFDSFGRLAVVHEGFYAVLNDTAWLDLADKDPRNLAMATVTQGRDGTAYYGALGSWGIAKLGADGKLRPQPLMPPSAPKWTLNHSFNQSVVTDQGVYFGAWNGVVYFDFGKREHQFFELGAVAKVFRIRNDVYVSAHGHPLQYIDLEHGTLRPIAGTDFDGIAVDQATSFDPDRALIATRDGRLLVFDGTRAEPWISQSQHNLTGRISAVQHLVDGGVAVAVSGKGLFLLTAEGDLFYSLLSPEYHRITDLAVRESGVLWVATEDGVVKVLYGAPLTVFGQRLGLPVSWPAVLRWNGQVLVASGGHLFRAIPGAPGSASRFELLPHEPTAGAWAVAVRDPHLLVGNSGGAFAAGADGRFTPVLSGFDVARLAMLDPDLCLAIGRTEIAALRRTGDRWMECAPRIAGVGFPSMMHIAKRSVWLELGANRVARLSLQDGRLQARILDQFPWPDSRWVNVGIIDDTVVLSGPPGWRVFFDERTETVVAAPELQRLLARSRDWIVRIQKDETGTLWATHDGGVVTFVPEGRDYRMDTTTFDLINDHYPAVQLLPGNDVWLSTGQSLYHVERRRALEQGRALRPMLVSIVDGRTQAELFPGTEPAATRLRLPFARNSLNFRFFSGGYAWRRSPAYEFKLNGVRESWAELGAGSRLSFPGLREGSYHLEFRIAGDPETAAPPQTFDFEIRPPWPRTSLAFAIYGLAAGLAVFGLVRWSGHRARHRNLVLEQIVRERTDQLKVAMAKLNEETRNAATLAERHRLAGEIHDSLQQGLSGLMLQLDATLKLPAVTGELRSRLNVARNMVSFTRHEVQHAVWDMESPLLEDTELGEALRKLTALISSGTARMEVDVAGTPGPLPSAVKHHLLRIAQEAITNAVRHAASRRIAIGLEYQEGAIALTVTDDGVGFHPHEILVKNIGHFGLRGLRGRAAKIGGDLQIHSAPGQGTTIRVVVPAACLQPRASDAVISAN